VVCDECEQKLATRRIRVGEVIVVHGLETMERLNRQAIEKSNRKYVIASQFVGQQPLPIVALPKPDLPEPELPKPPQRLSMDYPVGLLRMWRFCDEGNSRFALECVQVDFENGLIEATNGRIAVRHSFEVPEEFKTCGKVILLGECLEKVAAYAAKQRLKYPLQLVKERDEWFAADVDLQFSLHQGEGKFPYIPMVFKHVPSQSVTLHLNTLLLSKFMTAFKGIENTQGEPCTEITIPLDGTATWLKIREKPDGVVVDARLMPMSDDVKPIVQLSREIIWRKATVADIDRVARFRDRGENSFAYGLLAGIDHGAFQCRFSDNNEIVKHFHVRGAAMTWLLIDGNNWFAQCDFASPEFGINNFCKRLDTVLQQVDHSRAVVCWDGGKSWRCELSETLQGSSRCKAGRVRGSDGSDSGGCGCESQCRSGMRRDL
jgi:hypothetical protein